MRIEGIESYSTRNRFSKKPLFKSKKTKVAETAMSSALSFATVYSYLGLINWSKNNSVKKSESEDITQGYINSPISESEKMNLPLLRKIFFIETKNIFPKNSRKFFRELANISSYKAIGIIDSVNNFKDNNGDLKELDRLDDENVSDFMDTIILNNSIYDEEKALPVARFSLEEILELSNLYLQSKNKNLVLDLIKDTIYADGDFKDYRFNKHQIVEIVELYKNTSFKQVLLDMLAKKDKDFSNNLTTPVFLYPMMQETLFKCEDDEEAKFLSKILKLKTIDENGNKIDRFDGEDFYKLKSLYKAMPVEVNKLVDIENYSSNDIIRIIQYKNSIGDFALEMATSLNNNKLEMFAVFDKILQDKSKSIKNKKINKTLS